MLASNSGLPEIYTHCSRVKITAPPSWFGHRFIGKPDSFLTSHKCSPKLEESNHGLRNTAMSHQMEPLGSISSSSELSLWPRPSIPQHTPNKQGTNKDTLSQHKAMGYLSGIIKFPFISASQNTFFKQSVVSAHYNSTFVSYRIRTET